MWRNSAVFLYYADSVHQLKVYRTQTFCLLTQGKACCCKSFQCFTGKGLLRQFSCQSWHVAVWFTGTRLLQLLNFWFITHCFEFYYQWYLWNVSSSTLYHTPLLLLAQLTNGTKQSISLKSVHPFTFCTFHKFWLASYFVTKLYFISHNSNLTLILLDNSIWCYI